MSTPITPDQKAAHEFLTELRTRISTQPLPYQHGIEARALSSMWEVFGYARDAIKENPGCEDFAARTTHVLNIVVRPLTAKWHRALEDGRLNGRDGADEFRGEMQIVQSSLRDFASELHQMAYGAPFTDELARPVMDDAALSALIDTAPLQFGFRPHTPEQVPVAKLIADDEAAAIRKRRKAADDAPVEDAIGLALSGGGIRSATFGLGIVQVLAARGFLKEVDVLSTVSGGGYTGSFLTQRLGASEPHTDVAGPHGPDPEPVRYVRQNAQFLVGRNLKETWSMVTATLAGTVLNWSIPLFVVVVMALLATSVGDDFAKIRPGILKVSGILSALAMIGYGWGMRQSKKTGIVTGGIFGAIFAFTCIVGIGAMMDYYLKGLPEKLLKNWEKSGGLGAAIALVAAAIPSIIRFLPVLKEPKLRKLVLKVAMMFVGVLVPFVAVLLFYTFWGLGKDHAEVLYAMAAVFGAVGVFVVNINLTAPHRLYRDCLARTFIQKTADGSPDVKMTDINPSGTAPYHIINAALNVPSSESAALKDRGCDFFMFSKKWTGSTATGYERTETWKANGQDVDLKTAMAVSGAAFSSHMGLGAMPALTALLTMLNVRLGFWIRKPVAGGNGGTPGFTCLLRETLSAGLSEKRDWLNLSDGGHIENMAVYELLRRRCKFIICVDGESDPTFTFQGLMTLVRHAQIDFGTAIEPSLDDLRPKETTGFSKSHFHFCRIRYPEGTGLLLYIKLSVTGNEPELIKRYRTNNPEFPHQTTLDQFFDQEQFEAYRQLGVHAAEAVFKPALMDGMQPTDVRAWFRKLSRNLLEP